MPSSRATLSMKALSYRFNDSANCRQRLTQKSRLGSWILHVSKHAAQSKQSSLDRRRRTRRDRYAGDSSIERHQLHNLNGERWRCRIGKSALRVALDHYPGSDASENVWLGGLSSTQKRSRHKRNSYYYPFCKSQ